MARFLPAGVGAILMLNPLMIGFGAAFGGLQLLDAHKRKIAGRRQQARASVRQFTDDVQFEIIQNISGKSTYSEFLDRVPEGGIHHLGYAVDDYDAATKDLEARGYKLVQRGTFGDTRFGYYESDDDFGTLTEIIYLDPNVQTMFANLKAQTF